jgi:small subunit ribosomal protein S2
MQKTVAKKLDSDTIVEEMFKAGAHYGYGKRRRHPSVSSNIYTTKNKTDIINLETTAQMLESVREYVSTLAADGKVILFVGTKPEAKEITKQAALALDMPYVTERWIGGTLSNFKEIKKRITELENYQKDVAEGGLDKYTKRERTMLAKKMEKLSRYYSGLIDLKKLPDALFIVDPKAEHIAATEARKSKVPVIALANSDTNIKDIDHPIVCNDASIPSISFFVSSLKDAYLDSKESIPQANTQ